MIFDRALGRANIASLVERRTRFAVLFPNNDRSTIRLMAVMEPLPQPARRSITFDRGTEFRNWRKLKPGIGTEVWFRDPQAPWQKGTVEILWRSLGCLTTLVRSRFVPLAFGDPSDPSAETAAPGVLTVEIGVDIVLRVPGDGAVARAAALVHALRGCGVIVAGQRQPILIAMKAVDFRCGHQALAPMVQTGLKLTPNSVLTVIFRSKRGDRLKILIWDGTGMVLIDKVPEEGSLAWPKIQDGVMRVSRAQAEALFEGLD